MLGDVSLGRDSSIWYNSVLRGDMAPIAIGDETNIQDLCMVHADPGVLCVVGRRVTVGHRRAILHGCTIHDGALIGSGSVVLHNAVVETGALVGAGAVVTNNMVVPAGAMALGIPAKIREGAANPDEIMMGMRSYVERSKRYRSDLRRLD